MEMIEGITFDDVMLAPAYSEVIPRETNLETRLTKSITLKMPLVSAAMDTVTEYAMAKALARNGGVGVIHKNMSIKEQAEQVDRIKRTENGIIYDPLTIAPDKHVADADDLMREYKVGGLAVVNLNNELLGMVTNRDIRFEDDPEKIRRLLAQQLYAPVQWTSVMAQLDKRKAIEVGPGNTLAGLAKRATLAPDVLAANTPAACEHLPDAL